MNERIPLNNKEAETAVLGAILMEPPLLPVVVSKLFPEAFYQPKHEIIYKAILKLYDTSRPVDVITLVDELKSSEQIETVGGIIEIMKLSNSVVSTSNIEAHIMIILEMYMKRQTASLGRVLELDGYNSSTDPFDGLNNAASEIQKVSEKVLGGSQKSMSYYVTKVIEQRDRVLTTGQIGLDTGFKSLNECISGWVAPDLVIIAARPGMGKSAIMLSTLHHLSVKNHIPVAVFSLEMSGEQLTQRLESIDSGIHHSILRSNKLSTDERNQIPHTHDKLIKAPIYIEDKPGINIRELRTKANLFKRRYGVELIMIDYLQLMSGVDEKGKSRENIISEISRGCKLIAKELNVPVIALSQLSREVEKRPDRMPQLSDLRESGSIEQDADEVIFLMRPEYYEMQGPVTIGTNQYDVQGLVVCKIDKNRHGATKNIALKFSPEIMKYEDYVQDYSNNWRPVNDWVK